MRRIPRASQRRSKTVNHAQPGVGQRQASEQARQRHVLARLAVHAVAIDTAKRSGGERDPLDAKGIRQWIGACAHVRLDQLRQSTRSRVGCYRGRQRVSQLGIDQSDSRQHHGAPQARLRKQRFAAFVGLLPKDGSAHLLQTMTQTGRLDNQNASLLWILGQIEKRHFQGNLHL